MTHKTKNATEFYKQYGMTMAEMGRRTGVSKEAIRLRFKNGKKVDGPNMKGAGAGRKAKIYEGKTIQEWAKELNVPIGQMYHRISYHNDPHYQHQPRRIEVEGKTIQEWAKELNVPIGRIYYRIREHNDPRFKTRHFVWTKNQHKNAG